MSQEDGKGKQPSAENATPSGASTKSFSLEELTKSIQEKLGCKSLLVARSPSIFKVHEKFQKVKENAYTPELVSIGPFHRENQTLWCMKEHKLRYASSFISKSGIHLKDYVESMKEIENDTRKCYSVHFVGLEIDEFVEMMLLDGLFIIVLFEKYASKDIQGDPIFTNSWTISSLIRDLVLLENQIPMKVLQTLLEKSLLGSKKSCSSFTALTLKFFENLLTPTNIGNVDQNVDMNESKHLLDLLVAVYEKEEMDIFSLCYRVKQAGIEFKKASWKGSFLDISFRNGVLKIPAISIQDQTEVLFRNLIAYEQSSDGNTLHTISYAFFMDNLIDSPEDVKFLCNAGIITNYLGDHHDVSKLFNRLLCEVAMGENFFSELYEEVNEYYNAPHHAWRATLNREYFQNPWTFFSLLAAFILLGLTFIQTVYTVKGYVNPPK